MAASARVDGEPLFMIMMLVHDDGPAGVSVWKAVLVEGHGYALTREQAEAIVAREGPGLALPARVPRRHAPISGRADGTAPPLTMPPSSTIWDYGEPLRVDMIEVLRAAWTGGRQHPSPAGSRQRVGRGRDRARDRGRLVRRGRRHRVETAFDLLVMDLDGNRHGTPPFYGVPLEALGLR